MTAGGQGGQASRERGSYISVLLAYLVGVQSLSVGLWEGRHLKQQEPVTAAPSCGEHITTSLLGEPRWLLEPWVRKVSSPTVPLSLPIESSFPTTLRMGCNDEG